MSVYSNETRREAKRIKIDKEEIDNAYINQISEFVLDEHGSTFGYDQQTNFLFKLNKIKRALLAGKNEYDLIRIDLNNTKGLYHKLNYILCMR